MQEAITTFERLSKEQRTPRVDRIIQVFEQKYGSKPDFIARAPGRVSIIGEHIDYAGLSVMPAAIDRDVLMACKATVSPSTSSTSPKQSRVRVGNVNESKFPSEEVRYSPNSSEEPVLDAKAHSWVNYFKAGLKGVLAHLPQETISQSLQLDITVDGNVPPGGGLSSSAAMVVSSALAALQAYHATGNVKQGKLAEIAIESERLVGVNSGGMDQSASIFSKRNYLLNVGFVPRLVATLVPFPSGQPELSYVIANTLITSEKAVTAKYHYNLRVVEMRVVAAVLHRALQLESDFAPAGTTLKHVMDEYFSRASTHTRSDFLIERQKRLLIMLKQVEDVFGDKKDGLSWGEVYNILNSDEKSFKQAFHADFEIEAEKLQLYKRAKHAYSEARRVYQYRGLLEASDRGNADPGLGEKLGDLMNDSQVSCKDLFECSCPEIDEVCELARKAGALGSRLSGAGWGGCTVHLVPQELEADLIDTLKKEYYAKRYPDLKAEELDEAVFATKPEEGACLYLLNSA